MLQILHKLDKLDRLDHLEQDMQDLRARLQKTTDALERLDPAVAPEQRPSGAGSGVAPVGGAASVEGPGAPKATEEAGVDLPAQPPDHLPVDSELSIPIEHTTAAHKLLRWPSIQQFVHLTTKNEQYVMQGEERRGILRVWGRGEGGDVFEGDPLHVYSPGVSTDRDDVFRRGGGGFARAPSAAAAAGEPPRRPPVEGIGGLNPDGSLKIDTSTVVALMNSYVAHIHALHPFLDTERLTPMVCAFADRYGSSSSSSSSKHGQARSPYSVSSPIVVAGAELRRDSIGLAKAGKRKRSALAHAGGSGVWGTGLPGARGLPERSIGSAVVLLVAALGKICDHKEYLPGPVLETVSDAESASASASASAASAPPAPAPPTTATSNTTDSSPPLRNESPPVSVKHSPASSHSSGLTSAGSPQDAPRLPYLPGRPPSIEEWSPQQDRGPLPMNADVIPGLAYYAYATDILGNHLGGNELAHVQAGLLAGLYAGQLGRVLESWSWINWACRSCQVLVRRYVFLSFFVGIRRNTGLPPPSPPPPPPPPPTPPPSSLLPPGIADAGLRADFSRCNIGKDNGPSKNSIVVAFWTCLQLER